MTNAKIDHPVVARIRASGMSIYAPVRIGDPQLWLPTPDLEAVLDEGLRGLSLEGLALRTRSKVVKSAICQALGYPVPKSFKKTQPRFSGQLFDVYVQKSNNLQVWNEELSASRRYVLIRVSDDLLITRVKAVTGDSLALLDTTGTLTKKYQAQCTLGASPAELISKTDTDALKPLARANSDAALSGSPVASPTTDKLLPIPELFLRLSKLIGSSFADAGIDQERNRGAALHKLVAQALGYPSYADDGQFPDVRHQLLEVKLQTSPTIDLGLVAPSSVELLDVPMLDGKQIRHCDVRYAVFYGAISQGRVTISHLMLTTGEDFFSRFTQFQGKVSNAKLQIPLPSSFFN